MVLTLRILSLILIFSASEVRAENVNPITYQGRILRPDGSPLNTTATFRFIIKSPNNCILWQEDKVIDMTDSKGAFSASIGLGINDQGGSHSFVDVFDNGKPVNGVLGCDSGVNYTPGSSDDRKLFVSFNDGVTAQTVPPISIKSVPFSQFAGTATSVRTLLNKNLGNVAPTLDGQVLRYNSVSDRWEAGSVTAGVTSVALDLPTSVFSVGAAVSSVGTLSGTFINQAANTVFASPNGAAGAPTFRALVAADVPNLDASKITTGTFSSAVIGAVSLGTTGVVAGNYGSAHTVSTFTVQTDGRLTVAGSVMIAIDASQVASGTFAIARIPDVDASKVVSGTFAAGRIPDLDAAKIISGTLDSARIPDLNAGKLISGTLAQARIGVVGNAAGGTGLDSSVAGAGQFLIGNGAGFSLGTLTAGNNISILNQNGTVTISSSNGGGTVTQVNTGTGLAGGPFTAVGTISLADTSVVAGGYGNAAYSTVFNVDAQGRLTSAGSTLISVSADQVTSGTFNLAQVPDIDASKVVSGTLGLARIPDLDAAKLVTGTLANASLPVSGVGAGSFGSSSWIPTFITDIYGRLTSAGSVQVAIDANQVVSGTMGVNRGGTGVDGSTAANGQLLIGNGSGYALGTLTAGSNITITNSAGGITIASSNSGGTVTQVNSGTGLTGGPVSGVGTLSLADTAVTAGGYGAANYSTTLTVDQQGRLTAAGSTLIAINGNQVTGGTINLAQVPDLDASKIVSGTLGLARVPDLDASKIVAGTLGLARIPDLDAAKIVAGTLANARLPVSGVTAGAFSSSSFIPSFTVDAFGRLVSVGSNAISFPALQWTNVALGVNYASGSVGIGQASPATMLDVNGAIRIANDGTSCAAGLAGAIRYNAGFVEYCNGSGPAWQTLGISGSGLQSLNGLTANAQIFAVGSAGTLAAFTSAGSLHTLNIPLASTAGAAGGLVSNADYLTLMNGTIPAGRVADLDAGKITSGTLANARLPVSGVSAGNVGSSTYIPTLSIDAFGRITSYGSAAVSIPAAITSINGLTAAGQIFVVGFSGTLAAFSSAGSTNTLNIPMASAAGVAGGLLSKIDYDSFVNGSSLAANGTISAARGGTGLDGSAAGNGQLLIGNGAGYALGTLTAGSNITITNSAGGITIASSNSGGTVTQVNSGTGLTGGPINGVGTLSLSNTAVSAGGYGAPAFSTTFNVDQQGRLTAAGSTAIALNGNQITSGTINLAQIPDLDSSKIVSGTLANARLPLSGVAAGSFSSSTYVPSFTVDTYGRLVTVGSNAISFPALQWTNVALGVNYASGSVGIGQASPVTMLDVAGAIRIANDGTACAAGLAGAIRYNAGFVEYCNGSGPGWQTLGISGAGIQSLNGLTGNSQLFAVGSAGTLAAFSSAGTLHTLNIPLASTAGAAGGLLSNTDFLILTNGTIPAGRVADLDAGKITSGTFAQGRLGVVGNAAGGTGLNTSAAGAGQLLIGNGSGFALGTLSAGSNININNQNGTITISSTNSGGTVTQVNSGTGLTGGPFSGVGTLSLANTAVTPGGYGNAAYSTTLSVDQQGRLTSAGSTAIAIDGSQVTAGTLANARLPVSGAVAGSVGSATYIPTLTVDAFGRITSYGSAAISAPASITSINGLTAAGQIFVVGSSGTLAAFSSAGSTNTLNIPMASAAGVAGGLLSKIDYDSFATGASLAANGTISAARGGTGLNGSAAGNGQLLIGNGAGYALGTLTAGSNITITNSAGGITIASSNSGGTVTQVNTGAGLVGGPFSAVGTIALGTSGVSAGNYGSASQIATVNVDQYGRVIGAATVAVAIDANQVTSGTLANSRLPVSGVTAGAFSSSTYIPSFTVDAYGRLVTVGSNAISFPALQWSNVALGVNYASGSVGIGQASPVTMLDVAGAIRIANDATACAAGLAGAIRYNAGFVEYCNGSGPGWQTLGISGAGIQSLNGLTGNSQQFAVGSTGTLAAFSSAGTLHTLNIPLASTAGAAGGLLSNADYLTLTNGTIPAGRVADLDTAKITTGTFAQGRLGVVGNAAGGTGLNTSAASAGQLLIGNGSGFALGTLSAGSNININNQNGTITISSTNSGGTVTQVNSGTGLTGGPISGVGTLSLANTAVTPGGYGNAGFSTTLTVDQQGRLTAAGSTAIAIDGSQVTAGTLANARLPVSGAVAGSVGSATYIPTLTVDAFGRITSYGSAAISAPASITSINGLTAAGQIFVVGSSGTLAAFSSAGSTNTLNIPMASAAGVAGGLLSKIDYDSFVTGSLLAANGTIPTNRGGTGLNGSTAANGQLLIGNGAGYALGTLISGSGISIVNQAGSITISANNSGSVTQVNTGAGLVGGPISGVGTISLGTTGVVASSVGSASFIPQITFDAYGRITAVGSAAVAINVSAISGTLGVDKGGTGLNASTAANGALLIGNGSGFTLGTLVASNGVLLSSGAGSVGISTNAAVAATGNTLVMRDGSGNTTSAQATATSLRLDNGGAFVTVSNPIGANYSMVLPANMGTPGQVLSTNGTSQLNWTSVPTNGGTFLAASGSAAAPGFGFSADTDTGLWNPGANTLAFSTAGTNRISVTNIGYVGIGTDQPRARLQIGAGTDQSDEVGSPPQLFVNENGYAGIAVRDSSTNLEGQFYAWGGFTYIGSRSAHPTSIISANTERILIQTDGNIAIGTSAVGAGNRLEVTGGALAVGNQGQLRMMEGIGNGTNSISFRAPAALAQNYIMTLPGTIGTSGQVLSTDGAGVLSWTSVPSNGGTFLAAGGSAGTPGFAFSSDSDTGLWNPGANTLAISTAGTTRLTINNLGYVGIGNQNPTSPLSVSGRIQTSGGMLFNQGSAASDNLIYVGSESAGAVNASFGFMVAGAGSAGEGDGPYFLGRGNSFSAIANQRGNLYFAAGDLGGSADEGSIRFRTGTSVDRLIIDRSGGLSVGTTATSTGTLLEVTGGAITSGNGGEVRFMELLTNGTNTVSLRAPAALATSPSFFLPNTSGTVGHALGLTSAGSLGFMSVPANGGTFLAADGTAGAPGFAFNSDTDTGIYKVGVNTLGIATAGTLRMVLDNVGNAAIGASSAATANAMTNPARLTLGSGSAQEYLYVRGSGTGTNFLAGASNAASIEIQNANSTNGNFSHLGFRDNTGATIAKIVGLNRNHAGNLGDLLMITSNTGNAVGEVARFTGEGQMGVGTTSISTGSKLEVTGGAITSGNGGEVRFMELLTNGTNTVSLRAPAALATSPSFFLPNNSGTVGHALGLTSTGSLGFMSVPANGGTFLAADGSAAAPGFGFSADTDTGLWNPGTNTLAFSTAGTNRVSITNLGNVGIGTTNPDAALSIQTLVSNAAGPFITLKTASGDTRLEIFDEDWAETRGTTILSRNAPFGLNLGARIGPLMLSSGDDGNGYISEQMRVTSSGVSIGTTAISTGTRLEVTGGAITSGNGGDIRWMELLSNGTNTVGFKAPAALATSPSFFLPNTSGTVGHAFGLTSAGSLGFMSVPANGGTFLAASGSVGAPGFAFNTDSDTGLWNPGANTLAFSTAGTTRIAISANGNVGIGTSTPSEAFQIYKPTATFLLEGDNSADFWFLSNSASQHSVSQMIRSRAGGSVLNGDTLGEQRFSGVGGGAWRSGASIKAVAAQNFSGTSAMTDLIFSTTGTNSVTLSERLRISSTGFVGIGTSSVSAGSALEVTGGAITSGNGGEVRFMELLTNGTNTVSLRAPAALATSPSFFLPNNAGTVGHALGLTSTGSLGFMSVPANGGTFLAASGSAGAPGFAFNSDPDTGIYNPSANSISLATAGTPALTINNLGHTGIGTTGPLTSLHVAAPEADLLLHSTRTSGASALISLWSMDAGGVQKYSTFGTDWAGNMTLQAHTGVYGFTYPGGGSNSVSIIANGNVGIGTTSPNKALDIRGTNDNGHLHVYNTSGSSGGATVYVNQYKDTSAVTSSTLLLAGNRGTFAAPVAISSGDDVGAIVVAAAADAAWSQREVAGIYFSAAGNVNTTSSPGNIRFSTTTTGQTTPVERMRIDSVGHVGIGTTNPTVGSILDIAGSGTLSSSVLLPRDTTANRPTGVNGQLRYNTTTNKFEGYENGNWNPLQGAAEKWRQTANFTTTSTSYVDITNAVVAANAAAGDILHFRASCGMVNSGANSTFIRIQTSAAHTATIAHDVGYEFYNGGSYFDYNYVVGTIWSMTGTVLDYVMGDYDLTVGTAGVVSLKIQARASAGTATIQNCVVYIEKK